MSTCKVCGHPRSAFIMNNKTVCMKCDELLFDLEIECEEETPVVKIDRRTNLPEKTIKVISTTTNKK